MDTLHPRLLVARFAECFHFYEAALPKLIGADLVQGNENGPYAHWDVNGEGVLMLFSRAAMAAALGTADLPVAAPLSQDSAMLVCRVADVDGALAFCLEHGACPVVGATDRPEWGPTMRTAHLRDPDGNLLELQSY